MSLLQIAQALEASQFGTALRESLFWFPALNLVHLIGLTIAGGTIVFWDLRLLGVGLRRAPVSKVGASLLPWTWAGFAIMLVTVGVSFLGDGLRDVLDPRFEPLNDRTRGGDVGTSKT